MIHVEVSPVAVKGQTVPIQFFGLILISLGSGRVKLSIFLYHV